MRFTIVTTIVLGLIYRLLVTGLSQLIFPRQANGSLVEKNGQIIGSRLIAQGFTVDIYFHPRPSAAGAGYDPTPSGGSNLGPTNKQLVDRVKQDVAKLQHEDSGTPIPADMVTNSGSRLDPELSSASAEFQIARVAKARGISGDALRAVVARHTAARQLGVWGEARVNMLQLNLDENYPAK